ncbi:LacI family DNA-binding transcriptional regulator [Sulfobacillus harzensis]|uniref:LacI family transcriptional regulator n=1 Tax=Sulfobacillus harzensis TaxID=2729629 RepID=A0A7Y0L5Z2_9FIRM|nr:LacI family DNA-binding transcriptional regulator [Sulfobacillus harzensis]NMP23841.1 LacI family transcriptional regulator [Sulfobacillus harzensis]
MPGIPTSRDVAKLACVSQSTVSRVVSGKGNVSEETRRRVLEAAESLGYYVNEAARRMRTRRSRSIGIVLPSLYNPFYAESAHALYARAKQAGRIPLIQLTLNDPRSNQTIVKDLLGHRVEGLLMASTSSHDAYMRAYCADPVVPYVMYNRRLADGAGNWVVVDNKLGAVEVTNYLLARGHRDILFISGDTTYSTALDRLAGYREAMAEANLAPSIVHGNFDYGQTYQVMQRVLDNPEKRPSAIFAANDQMAFAVLDSLTHYGIHPKTDIAVVGFDDISWSSLRGIDLTTMSQRQDLMIQTALDGLLGLIDGSVSTVRQIIKPELVIRGTA